MKLTKKNLTTLENHIAGVRDMLHFLFDKTNAAKLSMQLGDAERALRCVKNAIQEPVFDNESPYRQD